MSRIKQKISTIHNCTSQQIVKLDVIGYVSRILRLRNQALDTYILKFERQSLSHLIAIMRWPDKKVAIFYIICSKSWLLCCFAYRFPCLKWINDDFFKFAYQFQWIFTSQQSVHDFSFSLYEFFQSNLPKLIQIQCQRNFKDFPPSQAQN